MEWAGGGGVGEGEGGEGDDGGYSASWIHKILSSNNFCCSYKAFVVAFVSHVHRHFLDGSIFTINLLFLTSKHPLTPFICLSHLQHTPTSPGLLHLFSYYYHFIFATAPLLLHY